MLLFKWDVTKTLNQFSLSYLKMHGCSYLNQNILSLFDVFLS